jgi:sugar phosphate isomerase/epimerase
MQAKSLLSLAYLTVNGAEPVAQIEAAAAAGFDAVGLRFEAPRGLPLQHEVIGSRSAISGIRQACQRTGIRVLDVEVLTLHPGAPMPRFLEAIDAAAQVGARFVQIVSEDPDHQRAVDAFAELCDAAAPCGIDIAVEFMRWRSIRTLEDAMTLISDAGRQNGRLCIDTLHLSRSGGSPAAVASVPRRSIGYVQLCDARAAVPPLEGLLQEARSDRLYPGDGALWLDELMALLPADVPLAIEVPQASLANASVAERAADAAAALKNFLARGHSRPQADAADAGDPQ